MKPLLSFALVIASAALAPIQIVHAQEPTPVSARVATRVGAEYPALFELYKELHARPELSFYEEKLPRAWPPNCAKPASRSPPRLAGTASSPC